MSLAPGIRLGPYEVLAPLGAGGMGEVYRAKDTRLGREVAIKVLPHGHAGSPEARVRFEREARAVSSLNHPHICTLHDVGREGDTDFLVMELIDGETLSSRLARGPLPAAEVVRIGAQIADALDRAHRAGLVHRDLKPANVMLTRAGAKLLDFGLARGAGAVGATREAGMTLAPGTPRPTLAGPLTVAGTIVGTFQYMAPEVLDGQEADARSDLWSLGCVLFEMATGRAAFEGKSPASLISAIMTRTPEPLSRLVPLTPPALDRLVGALLARDPEERIQTAHDVKLQLQWAGADSGAASGTMPQPQALPAPASPLRAARRFLPWVAVAASLAIAAFAWLQPPRRGSAEEGRIRLTLQVPANAQGVGVVTWPAISPDGRWVTFASTDSAGSTHLWLRDMSKLEPRMLAGTENADQPFWSPDSRWIGYFAEGKLKKVPLDGGAPEVLCDAPDPRGGAWGSRGTIVFAPVATGSLFAVAENGGKVTEIVRRDSTRGEIALRFPTFLPDGEGFLFISLPRRGAILDVQYARLGSDARHVVYQSSAAPVYVAPGWLLSIEVARMTATRFDARTGKVRGTPRTIGEAPPSVSHEGSPAISASRSGILAYWSQQRSNSRLEWWDRSGRAVGHLAMPPGVWAAPTITPDGKTAALTRAASRFESDLWAVDLASGQATRLTFEPTTLSSGGGVFSPDSRTTVVTLTGQGPPHIHLLPLAGGTPQPVLRSGELFKNVYSWTPDGKHLLFEMVDPSTGWDLWRVATSGDSTPQPVLRTPANETGAWISPDGRHLAYLSDESGKYELYVRSYPDGRSRIPIPGPAAGGANRWAGCWWSRDGRELLIAIGTAVFTVSMETGDGLRAGRARVLFNLPPGNTGIAPDPDLRRFLVCVPAGDQVPASMVVDQNWMSDVEKN